MTGLPTLWCQSATTGKPHKIGACGHPESSEVGVSIMTEAPSLYADGGHHVGGRQRPGIHIIQLNRSLSSTALRLEQLPVPSQRRMAPHTQLTPWMATLGLAEASLHLPVTSAAPLVSSAVCAL